MRVYVASSWRNTRQPEVVEALRQASHEVYDFRNPTPGETGFGWTRIDPSFVPPASPEALLTMLDHPIARKGFSLDMDALEACEACVLVLPCGRSAHLELGWATGAGRLTYVLLNGPTEPELMYLMNTRICATLTDLLYALAEAS